MDDLKNLTIRKASELLDSGKTTSIELVNYYIERIERLNPDLGAYLAIEKEYALKKAAESDERIKNGKKLGILDGIPCSIKDVITTKDIETTASSKILEGYIAPYTATAVRKLEESGVVILGKNNCDEFAMGSSTENSAYRIAKNPWDTSRVPGGSSGGSAVAVAADLCIFSLGTETGGSIRQPASLCNVVGIKPTYGRVSRSGSIAYGSSLDQIGTFGKCVEDVGIIMNIISGKDVLDATSVDHEFSISDSQFSIKGLKIGIPKEYFGEGLNTEVDKIVSDAIEKYKEMGAEIVDISLPHTPYATSTYYLLSMAEASSNLARYDGIKYGKSEAQNAKDLIDVYFKTRGKYLGDEQKRKSILGTFELSAGYYDAYYRKAQKARTLIKKDFDDAFTKVDCIMSPVSPEAAFKIGEKKDDPLSMYLADIYTISANLAGICALSLPAGFNSENLPVGLQIMGPKFAEGKILEIAKAYEGITDWHTKFPGI